jgi:hypothetical protein
MATTFAPKTVSPKQAAYIKTLLADRQVPLGLATRFAEDMPSFEASRLIDKLTKCPWKTAKSQVTAKVVTEIVPEGFYCVGVDYYKVQTSKTSGKRYAKLWVGGYAKWEFAPGALFKLTLADKLTEDQAAMFGKKTGHCCICSKLLTNPESVAAGIGPICSGKMGW